MIAFLNKNSKKNAVEWPQHQNANLVYEETGLKETIYGKKLCVRSSLVQEEQAYSQAGARLSLAAWDEFLLERGENMY